MAEDAQAVAQKLQDVSIAESDTMAQQQPPHLPNFPIPRELRDKIYGYLLHHEHLVDEPYHTRSEDKRGRVRILGPALKYERKFTDVLNIVLY